MARTILTEINSVKDFSEILESNPGIVIIKFGAEWCGPCKKIEAQVHASMNLMPDNVQCYIIDVDECFEIYAYLKSKKMVNGIPAILAYYKNNNSYIPSDSVLGAHSDEVDLFFNRCFVTASN
uniref:Thioredoxin domain-containing protein n=1 Tax=viral metagenome TaxID=1070528 RepID=A0A6C0D5U0_9ZZZZ